MKVVRSRSDAVLRQTETAKISWQCHGHNSGKTTGDLIIPCMALKVMRSLSPDSMLAPCWGSCLATLQSVDRHPLFHKNCAGVGF